MAVRLRPLAAALSVLVALPAPASAAETWTCWSEEATVDGGSPTRVTRCRLAGHSLTVDFATTRQVPAVLAPRVGSDGSGLCWYWTSGASDWVLLGVDDDGTARLGIDPDGVPGGPVVLDAVYPRCSSEPAGTPEILDEAYQLLARYEHPTPRPRLDPGSGVTGMPVHVIDTPPTPWSAALVSPHTGMRVQVETWVSAVVVDWGDGTQTTVPPEGFTALAPWPDGAFGHRYETKTCSAPGGRRCHPTLTAYAVQVAYAWSARYRAGNGAWNAIPVPATTRTVAYDVDEIVPVLTAVG